MKNISTEKCLISCIVVFATITNANAALDPKCYDDIKLVKDSFGDIKKNPDGSDQQTGTKKPISIDVAFPNPLPAGGNATFDFTKSKVPSGEMETPTPVVHPDFKLISSTKHTYTYQIPNRSADFNGKFTVTDAKCGFSSSLTQLLLPVR